MKKHLFFLSCLFILTQCADNELEVTPHDTDFPYQLILDAEEGADLPDAEDYDLEVTFADYLPGKGLPADEVVLSYEIKDMEDDFEGGVEIDKIVYEVEMDDCVYERELDFTQDGTTGTITLTVDPDLNTVPETFEIIFVLPGQDDTEGGFVFEITDIETDGNIRLGFPREFEYKVLDADVAGEWELELATEEEFEQFKSIFAPLNPELEELTFSDITGKVVAEFEFEEMKFVIELTETEEVTECQDGESETEEQNKEIEIEADYEAEDGELVIEGDHFIFGDDGEIENELDFECEAAYEIDGDDLIITFFKVIDEDHYEEGDELFANSTGLTFIFKKD